MTNTAFINNPSIVAGLPYVIVIRRSSASGELNLTAGTIDIFLNGAKGTADVAASDLTEASTSDMTLGGLEDGTQLGNCYFAEIMISPIVFADVEIAGGLS